MKKGKNLVSGRKKAFDEEVALDAAMHVFWQKGYAGASLSDLTEAMAINKPSMYRTFGNKEELFIKTTQHYVDTRVKHLLPIVRNTDLALLQRLKQYIMAIIDLQCNATAAKGCYLVLCQSELTSGSLPVQASELLSNMDNIPTKEFTEIFTTDPEAIKLGLNQNPEQKALSLYTLLKGTACMARSGFSQTELEFAVDNMLAGICSTKS